MRSFSILSKTNLKLLDLMMDKINEFVHDSNSEDKIIFEIYSYPLKKALGKKVSEKYMNTGVFTEFQR